ncbi:hypothetical protein BAE44_0022451 [Dichanthelium oligosanthes]|uniref:Uncharacterized protein n=1 Tax=Dichanthelium oligosanthes TaxID=888268 RepID=A0A1E5UUI4_9POAL|nr:hypothetical protein BAE44_0022451 [Dichanthelium oligosanthes]
MQFNVYPCAWHAAVISAAGGDCDHLDCHWGSFMVVFVDIKHDKRCSSMIYSSEVGAWSQQTFSERPCLSDHSFKPEPGLLVGNALYFLTNLNPGILKLGFATIDNCRIDLWSRVIGPGPDKDARFVQCRVINLPKVLPLASPHVNGFADGVGVLFVWMFDGLYNIDIKSEQVRKVPTTRYCHGVADVVPYMSFLTCKLPHSSTEMWLTVDGICAKQR